MYPIHFPSRENALVERDTFEGTTLTANRDRARRRK
jgi:hypothetical protein